MNGRRSLFLKLVLAVGMCSAVSAWGATLPNEVRTTTNAAAVKPQIQQFITPLIEKLGSADATEQAAAKEAIVAEVQAGAGTKPSDIFFDAYCEQLDTALKPLLKSQDFHVRLNVAVIAARVSERAANVRLVPTVVALSADDNEAVVLWAVKAAKPLVPPILNNGATSKANTLIPAVVAAAGKFPNSGPIVQSAYSALSIEQAATAVQRAAWKTAVPLAAKGMQDIMTKRIDEYVKTGVPQMPSIEQAPVTFLTKISVWGDAPAEQAQTIQVISNLISVAGQRVVGLPRQDRDSLVTLVSTAAKGLVVVGLEPQVKPLTTINTSIADKDFQDKTADLYNQLVKKYPSLKAPPKVSAGANVQ